jgi:hypothetical protein
MQQLTLFSESVPVLPITYYPDFLALEQATEKWQTNGFLAGTRQLACDAPRLPIYTSASGSENQQSG